MRERDLLNGSITKHIFRLALPSIGGMASFVVFNLTDTYFVSQLGTNALAAMGFTFPVVLIVGAISNGISMGAASLLSLSMVNNPTILTRMTNISESRIPSVAILSIR